MDTTVSSSLYNTEDTQHSNFNIKDEEEKKKKRRLEDELAVFSILTGIQQPDSSTIPCHSLSNTPTKSKPDSIYFITPPKIDGTNTTKYSTKMTAYDENPELDNDHDESEVSVQSGSTIWKVLTGVTSLFVGTSPEETNGETNHIQRNLEIPEPDPSAAATVDDETLEADEEPYVDFLEDPRKEMTWGRIIALSLMNKPWYNPNLKKAVNDNGDNPNANLSASQRRYAKRVPLNTLGEGKVKQEEPLPSLEKGWAYFEHVTLSRYIATETKSKTLERAEPGECSRKTKMYSPLWTPLTQMGDFGLGIGLYFSTLFGLVVMCFIAGLINIPNIIFFASEEYSKGQVDVHPLMRGSAACTDQIWVPCPTCSNENKTFPEQRFKGNFMEPLVLKNQCDGAVFSVGMVNWGTSIFFILGIFALDYYLNRMEVKFDEDEQTAQDYSIIISNPPHDANDPKEWKQFFEDMGAFIKVTCVTVCRDNDVLVRTLAERREVLEAFIELLPPGTPLDENNLARVAAEYEANRTSMQTIMALTLHPLGLALDISALYAKLIVLSSKIRGLSQLDYPVTKVFVTFETERAQRSILSAMSVGKFAVMSQNTSRLQAPQFLFGGKKVLEIYEAEEPSSIRWQDLNAGVSARIKQVCLTTLASWVTVIAVAFLIWLLRKKGTTYAAIAISISNAAFPQFGKMITNMELHPSESHKESSLYLKIVVFRWVNTAIITTIITPFTMTIGADSTDLIAGIYKIFIAEIITTNVVQLMDPSGHFQRHYLAPRASSQQKTNLCFVGTEFYLAERYTNMTKILFLALFYCAIYPTALFLAAISLYVNYYTDSFSLMRTWMPAPKLGTSISYLSRKYFFSAALVALVVASSYYWSGFPFDNLCRDESSNLSDSFTADIDDETLLFEKGSPIYRFCHQDLLRPLDDFIVYFPAIPHWVEKQEEGDWMTEDQRRLCQIYGWTTVAVFAFVVLKFILQALWTLKNLFYPGFEAVGDDMCVPFSKVPTISAYIPQVKSSKFAYPLVACDVEGLDRELFDWTDPDRDHSYYSLVKDAQRILSEGILSEDQRSKNVFSSITHYPDDDNY